MIGAISDDLWLSGIKDKMKSFVEKYHVTLFECTRKSYSYFEIGAFLMVASWYNSIKYNLKLENLEAGKYKFLTNPNGNQENFSFLSMSSKYNKFELRQQVRIAFKSQSLIAFTPDFIVTPELSSIKSSIIPEYAKGNRRLFYIQSDSVISAHECKSMSPFPELIAGFMGFYYLAHSWKIKEDTPLDKTSTHIAPTLFLGGAGNAMLAKMARSMEEQFPINIVRGMHRVRNGKISKDINRLLIDAGPNRIDAWWVKGSAQNLEQGKSSKNKKTIVDNLIENDNDI